VTDSIGL